eukprot:3414191-Amphidinium_carterae.1
MEGCLTTYACEDTEASPHLGNAPQSSWQLNSETQQWSNQSSSSNWQGSSYLLKCPAALLEIEPVYVQWSVSAESPTRSIQL